MVIPKYLRLLKVLLVVVVSCAATIVSSTPVGRNPDDVTLPDVYYDNFKDLNNALKNGHTIAFTVRPRACGLSTYPESSSETHIGITSRHWLENVLEDGEVILRVQNFYLEVNNTGGAEWVEQVLIISQNDGMGDFTITKSHVQQVPLKKAHVDRFGGCQLGTGVVAMDMTATPSEEMVPLGTYDFLREELLSGRQISGHVDITSCNGSSKTNPAASTAATMRGFTVDTYFVEKMDHANEVITMVSVWPQKVPTGFFWRRMRIVASKDGSGVASVRAYLDAEGEGDTEPASSDGAQAWNSNGRLLECNLGTSGLNLFSRRFDSEKTYEDYELLHQDGLAFGPKFHSKIHEDYCVGDDGLPAGNKVSGQTFRTWELHGTAFHEPSSAVLYQTDGDYTGNFVRSTEMTIWQTNEAVTGKYISTAPQNFGNTTSYEEATNNCYLHASAFLRSPRGDESAASVPELEILETMREVSNAIPLLAATFTETPRTTLLGSVNTARTSFSSARWDTSANAADGLANLVAYSDPLLVVGDIPDSNPQNQVEVPLTWVSYRMTVDISTTKATLEKHVMPILNGFNGDKEGIVVQTSWEKCALKSSTDGSNIEGKASSCTFLLQLER